MKAPVQAETEHGPSCLASPAYALKRPLDVAVSLLGLALLLLPMAAIALLILVTSGRPVLFKQKRPGLRARPFAILKFRTMRSSPGTDTERLTRLGRLLRPLSLDELPQLVNVLRGEMSLVGPRPQLLRSIHDNEMRRLDVRPGITGLEAVNDNHEEPLSWGERMGLDLWYVDHWSMLLDLRIILKTIPVALSRKNPQCAERTLESDSDAGAAAGEQGSGVAPAFRYWGVPRDVTRSKLLERK